MPGPQCHSDDGCLTIKYSDGKSFLSILNFLDHKNRTPFSSALSFSFSKITKIHLPPQTKSALSYLKWEDPWIFIWKPDLTFSKHSSLALLPFLLCLFYSLLYKRYSPLRISKYLWGSFVIAGRHTTCGGNTRVLTAEHMISSPLFLKNIKVPSLPRPHS